MMKRSCVVANSSAAADKPTRYYQGRLAGLAEVEPLALKTFTPQQHFPRNSCFHVTPDTFSQICFALRGGKNGSNPPLLTQ